MNEKSIKVVAALIRKDKKVLITERWPNKHMGLTWEFPGGKVEPGESDEQAIKREIKEELGVDIKVGSSCFQTSYTYSNKQVDLTIYRCEITSGSPQAIDVKNFEWVLQSELSDRPFPPADALFVQELIADRIPEEAEEEPELPFKPAQILRRINIS